MGRNYLVIGRVCGVCRGRLERTRLCGRVFCRGCYCYVDDVDDGVMEDEL